MLNKFLDKYIFTSTLKYSHNNFFLVNIPFLLMPIDLLIYLSSVDDIEKQKEFYFSFKESTKKYFMPRFKEFNIGDVKKLEFVKNFFIASGWGLIEIVDFDEDSKRAIVVLDNSPFAKQLKGKINFNADNLLRGVLAGIFSVIFKEDLDCVEVECFALNDKSCKFVIKPIIEFDLEKQIVRDQLLLE
ncbi:MAG: 4-vinyl reductase [Candidatus ainarchaeum sp.]|nr:4-vinyl reductase [Candidatus ainarchaeum sp.]